MYYEYINTLTAPLSYYDEYDSTSPTTTAYYGFYTPCDTSMAHDSPLGFRN